MISLGMSLHSCGLAVGETFQFEDLDPSLALGHLLLLIISFCLFYSVLNLKLLLDGCWPFLVSHLCVSTFLFCPHDLHSGRFF